MARPPILAKGNENASDGEIGDVAGLLLDEQTWAVRNLIIDTSNWWVGHKVLIAPRWIEAVTWFDKTVVVSVTRQAVKHGTPVVKLRVAGRGRRRSAASIAEHPTRP